MPPAPADSPYADELVELILWTRTADMRDALATKRRSGSPGSGSNAGAS